MDEYLDAVTSAGFGAAEIRSRKPYRMLDAVEYQMDDDLLLETIEMAAFRVPMPADGPCVFTGRFATYRGPEESFDDDNGHVLPKNTPIGVCDKTAAALKSLPDVVVTDSTWHYQGDGCC